ncbi:MAG TPA: hypothetical protein DCM02_11615 [Flavobacterium sp.]|nr:hypothetical protein [Flavobacterium sp.]
MGAGFRDYAVNQLKQQQKEFNELVEKEMYYKKSVKGLLEPQKIIETEASTNQFLRRLIEKDSLSTKEPEKGDIKAMNYYQNEKENLYYLLATVYYKEAIGWTKYLISPKIAADTAKAIAKMGYNNTWKSDDTKFYTGATTLLAGVAAGATAGLGVFKTTGDIRVAGSVALASIAHFGIQGIGVYNDLQEIKKFKENEYKGMDFPEYKGKELVWNRSLERLPEYFARKENLNNTLAEGFNTNTQEVDKQDLTEWFMNTLDQVTSSNEFDFLQNTSTKFRWAGYAKLVATGHVWDMKNYLSPYYRNKEGILINKGIASEYYQIGNHKVRHDTVGNLFLGYIGAGAGFSEEGVLVGAGIFQINDRIKEKGTAFIFNGIGEREDSRDDKIDQVALKAGKDLWEESKGKATIEDINSIIEKYELYEK